MTTTKVTSAIGARLTMKLLKLRSVAPAMMMFGGSPISVAVPPMLEAITSITIERDRVEVQRVRQQEGHGTISRIVVRLSRNAESSAVVRGEADDDRERTPLRELPGTDRDVVIDAGLLGQVDEDHHPDEQSDRVEVHGLDRLLLREVADEQDDDGRPEERDLRPMDALGGDHREGDEERCDGDRHQRTALEAGRGA